MRSDLEDAAVGYGVSLSRAHVEEVRRRTLDRIERTTEAVRSRLESQIQYWQHRSNELTERERAGKLPRSGMNSARARERAEGLRSRLRERLDGLEAERQLSSTPPVVAGGALVIPAGLLASIRGDGAELVHRRERERSGRKRVALDAVLETERALGREAAEVPFASTGFDIESRDAEGNLLFLQVKCSAGKDGTVSVARSEIGVGRNFPEQQVLALVDISDPDRPAVRYLRYAYQNLAVPPFDVASLSVSWQTLVEKARIPS